jgi:hypothetical protein
VLALVLFAIGLVWLLHERYESGRMVGCRSNNEPLGREPPADVEQLRRLW